MKLWFLLVGCLAFALPALTACAPMRPLGASSAGAGPASSNTTPTDTTRTTGQTAESTPVIPAPPRSLPRSPQRTRGYLALRYGRSFFNDKGITSGFETDSKLGEDLISGSLGFNWGRYFGLEIAVDAQESDLLAKGHGKVGEYTVAALVPQVRLRYPLLDDKLTPYIVGGVGVALSEFNDRTTLGDDPAMPKFKGNEVSTVYSLGAGLEVFIADNLAVGIELKHLFHQADVEVGGVPAKAELDSFLLSGGLRLFFPGPPKPPPSRPPSPEDWWSFDPAAFRPYFGLRVGWPFTFDEAITEDFEIPTAERQQVNSINLGLDFNRHLGLDLDITHYETAVFQVAGEKAVEMAVWALIPQVRVRFPLVKDRLVPYLLGGAGAAFIETNDRTPLGDSAAVPRFSARSWTPAAMLGGGIEYFIADNMTLGIEGKYLYHRDNVEIDGQDDRVKLDAAIATFGIRIYIP